MYCDKCGFLIEEGCRFCEHCGNPVSGVSEVQTDVSINADASAQVRPCADSYAAVLAEAQPPVNMGQPVSGEAQPYVNMGQPVSGEAQPYVNMSQPVSGEAQPYVNMNQFVSSEAQPGFYDYQSSQGGGVNAQGYSQDGYMNGSGMTSEPKRKKSPVKWIVLGACGCLVIAAALVLLFSKSVKNTINKAVKTEEEYYQDVEAASVKSFTSAIYTAYDAETKLIEDFTASKYSISMNYALENPDSELLEEIEKMLGDISWLEKASIAFDMIVDDKQGQFKGDFSVNNEKLADFDIIGDIDKGAIYSGLPFLTDKYLFFDIDDIVDLDEVMETVNFDEIKAVLPDSDQLQIVDKYIDIALAQMSKTSSVESSVTAGGVSQDCDKVTVILDDKVKKNIIRSCIEEAKQDVELKKLFVDLFNNDYSETSGEEVYEDFIDSLDRELENLEYEDFDEEKMNVFINSKGEVIGRELKDEDGNVLFSYAYAIDGDSFGFKAFSENSNGVKTSEITISDGQINNGSISGTVKVSSRDEELIRFKIKDINFRNIMDGEFSGTVIFDLYKLSGEKMLKDVSLNIVFDCAKDDSEIRFELAEDEKVTVSLSFAASVKSSEKIKLPSDTIETDIDNPSQSISEWFDSFEWDKLRKAAEKAKLPEEITDILDSLEDLDLNKFNNPELYYNSFNLY